MRGEPVSGSYLVACFFFFLLLSLFVCFSQTERAHFALPHLIIHSIDNGSFRFRKEYTFIVIQHVRCTITLKNASKCITITLKETLKIQQ